MRLIDADITNMKLVELYNQESSPQTKEVLRAAMQVILNAPTITPPPNDPLTLEELRKMEGEPLYIVSGKFKDWRIPDFIDEGAYKGFVRFTDRSAEPMNDYGKTWLAYHRRPEGGDSNA